MKYFSIVIPTYEMRGKGHEYLDFSFKQIYEQSFKDYEIIISDNSRNNDIKNVCNFWMNLLDIKYYTNDLDKLDNPSSNLNNAIKKSTGKYIKILFLDDFFNSNKSLEILYNFIENNPNYNWYINACNHTNDGYTLHTKHIPSWNDSVYLGKNTIGSPSVVCIKNTEERIDFNENLIWLMDCEYYKRYYDKFGLPAFLKDDIVTIRISQNQLTSILSQDIKNKEVIFMQNTYKN
jgi:hypothetical protein